MKVLWIAYHSIPIIMNQLEPENQVQTGGWMQGSASTILCHDEIELFYCFPYKTITEGEIGGIKYYTVNKVEELHSRDVAEYKRKDFERFKEIVDNIKPDVIHIYGTETLFQRQFVQMAYDLGKIDITISWIQGLVSVCSKCYTNGLTIKQIKRKTFWELIRGTNIEGIQNRLALNGDGEIRTIKTLKNVFVRTDWDIACCKSINSDLNLYKCNETLRPVFFENIVWRLEKVERHSIFVSQYGTPIKGFHKMLQAMKIILKEFPDTILYTTGTDLFEKKTSILGKLRDSSYEKILRKMLMENNLKEHVKFLGSLDGEQMRNRYVKSHVFVSASSIENSPNSVGEAMILGVPIVASDVGGVSSMLTHYKEGLLYPYNEEALLAEYVCKIFRDDNLAAELSSKTRVRGLETHDKEKNYKALISAYRFIIAKSGAKNE